MLFLKQQDRICQDFGGQKASTAPSNHPRNCDEIKGINREITKYIDANVAMSLWESKTFASWHGAQWKIKSNEWNIAILQRVFHGDNKQMLVT